MKLNEYTLTYVKNGNKETVKFISSPRGLYGKMTAFSLKNFPMVWVSKKVRPLTKWTDA